MRGEVSGFKIFWYSFLYSLALVPAGLLLAGLTCAGTGFGISMLKKGLADSGAANGLMILLIVLLVLVLICIIAGSFWLSYRLGRDKAERAALEELPQAGPGEPAAASLERPVAAAHDSYAPRQEIGEERRRQDAGGN